MRIPGWLLRYEWSMVGVAVLMAALTVKKTTGASLLAGAFVLFVAAFLWVCLLRQATAHYSRLWLASGGVFIFAPVLLHPLWYANVTAPVIASLLVGLMVIAVLIMTVRGAPPEPLPARLHRPGWTFWLIAVYVGTCVLLSYWLPEAADRLVPRAAGDYVKHHAVLLALDQHGLPLQSPFYADESAGPYYYYHFYYLVPAALRKLSHGTVSIGGCFALASAWLAVTLMGLTYALTFDLFKSRKAALLAACCVSIVGGWDAIAIAIQVLFDRPLVAIGDAWVPSPWRIHNIATQFVWCPQHVAALVALLWTGMLLRVYPHARFWIFLAPLVALSIFGLSVYVAMTAFLAAAIYVLLDLAAARTVPRALVRRGGAILVIAVLGMAMMWPLLTGYREMSARMPGEFTTSWDRFPYAVLGRLVPAGALANLLDAPWILLVDLGAAGLALILVRGTVWHRIWHDPAGRLLLLAGGLGVLGTFIWHSTLHEYVYGFRVCVMPINVLAACLVGALLIPEHRRVRSGRLFGVVLVLALAPGLAVGFGELPYMAVRSRLEAPAEDLEALRYLREQTPTDAVVQGGPVERTTLVEQVDRHLGVMDPDNPHVQVFTPRSLEAMRADREAVTRALAGTEAEPAWRVFRRIGIEYVLFGSSEREAFSTGRALDDGAWFECVHRDSGARVYRVLPLTEE